MDKERIVSRRVVLIDDTEGLRRIFADHLIAAGYRVAVVGVDEAVGLDPAADVAIVDGDTLGDQVSFLYRGFASKGGRTALVVLATAPGLEADAVLIKPVRLAHLIDTVGRLASRRDASAFAVSIGPWRFDAQARSLTDGKGGTVRLTDKETAILFRLCEAGGVVARDRLLADIWGYAAGISTHTLETHVYRLRRKLGAGADGQGLLRTEPGGYRLERR
jgi:DNA-binding response OmpR family regulator